MRTIKTAGDDSKILTPLNEKRPLTGCVNGRLEVERKGVEPSTFALRTRTPTVDAAAITGDSKRLTPNASRVADARCTNGCTGEAKNDNATAANQAGDQAANDAGPVADQGADSLAMLAAALKGLSTAERAKLAAMLADGDDDDNAAGKPKAASKPKRTTKRPARKGNV